MIETAVSIISDDEVAQVHGNANFGSMRKRDVVNEGVLKVAFGYHCGPTMRAILADHGLIQKTRGGNRPRLTKKGYCYLRAAFGPRFDVICTYAVD